MSVLKIQGAIAAASLETTPISIIIVKPIVPEKLLILIVDHDDADQKFETIGKLNA